MLTQPRADIALQSLGAWAPWLVLTQPRADVAPQSLGAWAPWLVLTQPRAGVAPQSLGAWGAVAAVAGADGLLPFLALVGFPGGSVLGSRGQLTEGTGGSSWLCGH